MQSSNSDQVYATLSRQFRRMSLPNISQNQKNGQLMGHKIGVSQEQSNDDYQNVHSCNSTSSSSASQGWLRGNILRAFRRSKPRPKSIAIGCDEALYANQQQLTGLNNQQQSNVHSNNSSDGNFYLGAEMISYLQRQISQKDEYIRQLQMESSKNVQQLESLKGTMDKMREQFNLLRLENERLHRCIDNSTSIKLYSDDKNYP